MWWVMGDVVGHKRCVVGHGRCGGVIGDVVGHGRCGGSLEIW